MKRPKEILVEENTTETLVSLTSAFEGIASTRLARIKNQVLQSNQFFNELWQMYSQLRVDNAFHFGRSQSKEQIYDKDLFILITAEGGFSGDIDQRLIHLMLETYDSSHHEIIVIGRHGANQLNQLNIDYKKFYKLPTSDQNINTTSLVNDIKQYKSTTVFYQQYLSLTTQKVRSIQISTMVQEKGQQAIADDEVISDITYIFEPSVFAVVDHLESAMLYISLSQLILDSKLAQYASRFQAMSASNIEAVSSRNFLHTQYRRAIRSRKDERLKETLNSMRVIRGAL
jgi:ATP synthase F1 gamma subunit